MRDARSTSYAPLLWTRGHLDRLVQDPATTAPVIGPVDRALPGHHIWDMWPVQEEDGSPMVAGGAELWMALSAPAVGHPEERHDRARIRLLTKTGDRWDDLGDVFADGASPGSREWSGSAVRRPDGTVSVFYTAAGLRGEPRPTFHQRVVEARPRLSTAGADRDTEHRVVLAADGHTYLPANEVDGGLGRIRAFRDPYWFRDPADGHEYLLVAASVPWRDGYMGAIALATATYGGWALLPPLVCAEGVNHELERPHLVVHQSRYYLFFCVTRQTFRPADSGPTALCGFVAPALTGPYEPLNGSGVVIQNPPDRADQAYAWLVLPSLRVESFVNYLSTGLFGGTPAPALDLVLHETSSELR